jgi:hypothetical protein
MKPVPMAVAALLAIASGPAAASCEGSSFYPPGDNPISSLTISGTLSGQRLSIAHATLGLDPTPMTMLQFPAAQRLGLAGTKNRLALDLQVDPAAAVPRPSHARVTVFYPVGLTSPPLVVLTAGSVQLRGPGQRDPREPKLSDVYADFPLAAGQAGQFAAGSVVQVKIFGAGNALLEQGSFRVPRLPAWRALTADARKDMRTRCEADAEGSPF